jgi:phosphoribosylglycinamide formyltransferase-1
MPASQNIVVLISGGGRTLQNLIEYSQSGSLRGELVHVISSNPAAAGLQFAEKARIPYDVFSHRHLPTTEELSAPVFDCCRRRNCDLVVMGGFVRKLVIPDDFQNRVINIHPSLIPAFCGHGFYGIRVHQAVLKYGCKITGCTVHYVDDEYDHGPIIAQRAVPVLPNDTPEVLQRRVFAEECRLYPHVINELAQRKINSDVRHPRPETTNL